MCGGLCPQCKIIVKSKASYVICCVQSQRQWPHNGQGTNEMHQPNYSTPIFFNIIIYI